MLPENRPIIWRTAKNAKKDYVCVDCPHCGNHIAMLTTPSNDNEYLIKKLLVNGYTKCFECKGELDWSDVK